MKYKIVRLESYDNGTGWIDRITHEHPETFNNIKDAVKKFKKLHRGYNPGYNDIIRAGKKYITTKGYLTNKARVFSNIWIYNNIEM